MNPLAWVVSGFGAVVYTLSLTALIISVLLAISFTVSAVFTGRGYTRRVYACIAAVSALLSSLILGLL